MFWREPAYRSLQCLILGWVVVRTAADCLVWVPGRNLYVSLLAFQQEGIPLMMETKLGCERAGDEPVGKPVMLAMLSKVTPR